jgi:hypothetical protein
VGMKFLEFNSVVLSVVDDVPVNSEVPMMTSSILRICRSVFEDAHRVGFAYRDEAALCLGVPKHPQK